MFKKGFQTLSDFVKGVRSELMKVTYPSKNETIGSTTVVIVFTVIVSMFLAIIDVALVRLLRLAV